MKIKSFSFICLAMAVSTLAVSTLTFSTAQAGSDVKPITTLNGLRLGLIEGNLTMNCRLSSPATCKSRKDINIPSETTAYFNQTITEMIPGQERYARQQAEAKSIREENERLRGTGQELQIAKNTERLNAVMSEVHSDYATMHFVSYLWNYEKMELGRSRFATWETDAAAIKMDNVQNKRLTIDHSWNQEIGRDTYGFLRQIIYSYNPLMEMSFVVKVNSFVSFPKEAAQLYASEELVARCEERRIHNTVFKITTTLSERHLVCKLPENLGHLRFKVIEEL